MAHFGFVQTMPPTKMSLFIPELRYFPVSVTVVPPNIGPKSGWMSVMLGS